MPRPSGQDAQATCAELLAALDRAKAMLGDDIQRYPGVPGGGIADASANPRADIQQEIQDLELAIKQAGCA